MAIHSVALALTTNQTRATTPAATRNCHVIQYLRPSVSRHDLRRKPRAGDRLRGRRLPAAAFRSPRPTSSPISTSAGPASRASPPSGRSRTRSRSCPGVFADEATGRQVTTGTPIALLIENVDQRSKDYSDDQGHLSARPRRLHLRRQIRAARLSRRRPRLGARNRHAGGGRRDRAQDRARAAACAAR